MVTRRLNWGEDRVMYFNQEGKLRSMLTSWTSVAESDLFAQVAAERSWFRFDDLLALGEHLDALGQKSRPQTVK
ncbi:MAG: transposase [Gammaproteobacteria bacterium]|nr:transposase [Gammaproteobacteria bacterium]